MRFNLSFFQDKKVFVTGHTGFKGSWLCKVLIDAGAKVKGFSLMPPTTPNLYTLCGIADKMESVIGDIRDLDTLQKEFSIFQPEIVIHLAAQPIVRESYKDPVGTYSTNVMGTVHICECIRRSQSVKSFLNVTTDKVYENKEWEWGYRETDALNGFDPYSNSKSCSELVTQSYIKSFFDSENIAVSTARAGNVIGGGDFSVDRIIPDCFRAALEKKRLIIRNPKSIRPYQHVLEPVMAYLMIVAMQYEDINLQGSYNIGPIDSDCVTTKELVTLYAKAWGEEFTYEIQGDDGPHEANLLKLDCAKIKRVFGWQPKWNISQAIEATVTWEKAYQRQESVEKIMEQQIREYVK